MVFSVSGFRLVYNRDDDRRKEALRLSLLLATVHLQTVLQESCGVETPRNEERLLVRIRVLEQVQPEETHEEVWTLRLNWMLEV